MCHRTFLWTVVVFVAASCVTLTWSLTLSVKERESDTMSNPVIDTVTSNTNGSVESDRVNYSSITDSVEDGGSFTPDNIDFSSIEGILQALRMLVARRDLRQVVPRPPGVNETCYDQTVNAVDALLGYPHSNASRDFTTPNWALHMFDSFGKPASGLLEGSLQWVGAYEECLNVHAFLPAGTRFGSRVLERSSEFDTNYCRVEILLDRGLWEKSSYAATMNKFWNSEHSPDLVLNWGMCLPESCSGWDIQQFLNKGLLSSLKLQVQDVVCYEEDSTVHEDPGAICVIIVLSLFGSIVITCTIVETFWHYARAKGSDKQQSAKDASAPMLKDGTDLTLIIPAVEKEKIVSNGSPANCKTAFTPTPTKTDHNSTGNGEAVKTTCNGIGSHEKALNPEDRAQLNINESNHKTKQNGTKMNGSVHYQINTLCDEQTGKGNGDLDVEKELPVIADGSKGAEKDEIKTCLQGKTKSKREGLGPRIVKAFSMRMNLIRLLKTSGTSRPGVIRCLDGMRVVSMLWIILGHTYTFGAVMDNGNLMFANTVEVAKTTARVSFFLVTGATFAVDTFFLMSGLLVAMLTLKDLRKNRPSCKFWSLFYFHRIWRLTPVYMVVLMFCVTMYDHTVSGPLKSMPLKEYNDCHSKWWTHLLYINNLYEPQQKCMTWTWYLAVDMQLFSIAPIIIYVLHRSTKLGLGLLLVLVAAGMFSAFLSQYTHYGQFVLMDQVFTKYWEHVYIVPWTRIGAFAIGMFTGVIILDGDQKPFLSKAKAFCIWVILALVAFVIIFIPHSQWKEGSNLWPQSVQALYEALSRPTWAACVAMVIYLCHTGRGGVANNILSWPGFQPFARITYAVYLVHPVVMTFFVYSRNTPVYLQDTTIMYQYIGNAVFSYVFGTFLCIMFESPIMTLEKILLRSQ